MSAYTAAAIIAGAITAHENHGDKRILVSPSDHIIADPALFEESVKSAIQQLLQATCYWWQSQQDPKRGMVDEMPSADSTTLQLKYVCSFVEKPDIQKAEELFDSEKFLWNSGIFLFSTKL